MTNPYTYTARELDLESGLYYYRARYYDPTIGRFLQEDPIGFSGGVNFYSYVDNNPINWVDPWGLLSIMGGYESIIGGLGGGGWTPVNFPGVGDNAPSTTVKKDSTGRIKPVDGKAAGSLAKSVNKKAKEKGEAKKESWWDRLKKKRIRIKKHGPHHKFGGKKRSHIQITVYEKGVEGSHKNYYIALP